MSEEEVPFLPPEQRQDLGTDVEEQPLRIRRNNRLRPCRVFGIVAVSVTAGLFLISILYHGLGFLHTYNEIEAADQRWIATSESAADRFFCRWIGICGGVNWLRYKEPSATGKPEDLVPPKDWSQSWIDPSVGQHPEEHWSAEERAKRDIPPYVLEHAPLLHLHSEERYWPNDPAEHLAHSQVRVGEEEKMIQWNLSLATLGNLNAIEGSNGGRDIYITSLDDPESRPEWMLSRVSKPGWNDSSTPNKGSLQDNSENRAIDGAVLNDSSHILYDRGERSKGRVMKRQLLVPGLLAADGSSTEGLRSNAPAILVTVDKGSGVLDAFWFFFYSFNEGNTVFGMRFGNHIGDWEHVMVRFRNGTPESLYLSRHSWGSAFTYDAMEKSSIRPIVYSGNGSHAHYPTAGPQPYVLPFGLLKDVTSRGPLWDPLLNLQAYTYDIPYHSAMKGNGTFRASALTPQAPTSWLEFNGRWGDHVFPLNDWRQYRFFGELHYSTGPTGPRDKSLERASVCDNPGCSVKDSIG